MGQVTLLRQSSLSLLMKAGLVLFVLFICELFFFGSGLHYSIDWLTPRKAIFCLFSIIAFIYFCASQDSSKQLSIQVLFAWTLYFLIWIVILWLVEARPFSYGLRDALPLVGVMVFYLSNQMLAKNNGWKTIRKWLAGLIFGYAVLHIVIFVIGFYSVDLVIQVSSFLQEFMEQVDFEVPTSVFIQPLESGLTRVYFVGSCMLLVGLYFSLGIYQKRKFYGTVYLVVICLGLCATLTRSFLLASLTYFFVLLSFKLFFRDAKLTVGLLTVLIISPFFLSFLILFAIEPSLLAAIGMDRAGSDELRYEQLQPLLNAFFDSPLWGHGFGLSVEPIRNEDGPYSYELSIVALLAKLGVLGLSLAGLILGISIHMLNDDAKAPPRAAQLYGIYFAFIIGSFFNPYLFSFYGTLFLLFILFEYSNLCWTTSLNKKKII